MSIQRAVPWAQYEQIDIPTTGLKATSGARWRNSTPYPIEIERLLIDSNSVTTAQVRFGIRGKRQLVDTFVHTRALHNYTLVANQTTDGAWPLWRFLQPAFVPPRQSFTVTLSDKVAGSDRNVNVQFLCSRHKSPSEVVVLTDRVTVPSGGSIDAIINTDEREALSLHAFSLYIEETGSVANLRGLTVKVQGGALPDWMDREIRGSVLFPDSNPAASILAFETPLVIQPGETFEAEFRDTSGSAQTLYLGAVGVAFDRRSV